MGAIAFLLDENVARQLGHAVARHNQAGSELIDVVQVGEAPDLPLGSDDPTLLIWTEREQRILLSNDYGTLPDFLDEHLASGRHSPGVFLIRRGTAIQEMIDFLVLVSYASNPEEWHDRVSWVP